MNPATAMEPGGGALDEASPDSSLGYRVCLDCLPNGTYRVSRQPLTPAEDAEDMDARPMSEGGSYSTIEEAIKAVAAIVQENPMGEDANEQAGFEAGYPPPPARATMTPEGPMQTLARRPPRRPMTA
jgi:hypothetical protein